MSLDKNYEKIDFLIAQNKNDLLDSHLKYGGVYVARIDMTETEGFVSLEVEIDGGTIAFSHLTPLEFLEEVFDYIHEKLRLEGIGTYYEYADFEEALFNPRDRCVSCLNIFNEDAMGVCLVCGKPVCQGCDTSDNSKAWKCKKC